MTSGHLCVFSIRQPLLVQETGRNFCTIEQASASSCVADLASISYGMEDDADKLAVSTEACKHNEAEIESDHQIALAMQAEEEQASI